MKNKFIIATLFSAFLLMAPNVKAANFKDNQRVDSNKAWTVKFTGEVGFDDATKEGINVTDSKGNIVPVVLKLGQDSKTVIVTAPEGGYKAGGSYILNVGSKAHSNKGKALKNEYKVHFNIKNKEVNNDIVTFKDKNLEQAVRNNIKKPIGDIYKSDVDKVTFLDARNFSNDINTVIKDISGIENLINLQYIYLDRNQISDISCLKELFNLKFITLEDNQINDLSSLQNLNKLEFISFNNNARLNLGSLNINEISDISSLSRLTNLKSLHLSGNQISDISPLNRLTNLECLDLSSNQISNIMSLRELKNLQNVSLDDNQISDISSLQGLVKLKYLKLSKNKITDYSPVKEYYNNLDYKDFKLSDGTNTENVVVFKSNNLEQAVRAKINKPIGDIYKTDVENIISLSVPVDNYSTQDITGIETLVNLQSLDLAYNQINDISSLKALAKLQSLNLKNTNITDISVLKNLKNLQSLDLGYNKINDFNVLVELSNLKKLSLPGNQISNVNILKELKGLEYLDLSWNKISDDDKKSIKDVLPKCSIFFNLRS